MAKVGEVFYQAVVDDDHKVLTYEWVVSQVRGEKVYLINKINRLTWVERRRKKAAASWGWASSISRWYRHGPTTADQLPREGFAKSRSQAIRLELRSMKLYEDTSEGMISWKEAGIKALGSALKREMAKKGKT